MIDSNLYLSPKRDAGVSAAKKLMSWLTELDSHLSRNQSRSIHFPIYKIDWTNSVDQVPADKAHTKQIKTVWYWWTEKSSLKKAAAAAAPAFAGDSVCRWSERKSGGAEVWGVGWRVSYCEVRLRGWNAEVRKGLCGSKHRGINFAATGAGAHADEQRGKW